MSGKSKEEIAFELVSKLKGVGVWGENNMKEILNMYAECLEATSGLRTIEGRKQPSALRSNEQNSVPTAAGQAAPAQPPRAPQPPVQQPPVQQQSAAQQPVHQQQQRVQQAYQQQPVQQTR
jgi:hypothetical protein